MSANPRKAAGASRLTVVTPTRGEQTRSTTFRAKAARAGDVLIECEVIAEL